MDRSEIAKRFARDRHFCTRVIMQGWDETRAGFIVREHACHPRLAGQGEWHGCGRAETGQVREQAIEVAGAPAPLSASLTSLRRIASRWRRIELALDTLTDAGETVIRVWSNLAAEINAGQVEPRGSPEIAALYRTRWRIEGMLQRLESVVNSEIRSLGEAGQGSSGGADGKPAEGTPALRCWASP